jgi:glycerol uptake facilitator-like aquaporin
MKKYSMELVGTFIFVLTIIGVVNSATALAPILIGLTLAVVIYI